MTQVLVIGYGNTLRSDDALGPKVAEAIEELHLPGVRVIRAHQLTPELADPLSLADGVVFVDASIEEPRQVRLRRVPHGESDRARAMPHCSAPAALLDFTRTVFGHSPPAWTLHVPAFDLEFGEQISPSARAQIPLAVNEFTRLWASIRAPEMDLTRST